jgi:outer membrane protein OmpA-like peptidoglycan-associated protein
MYRKSKIVPIEKVRIKAAGWSVFLILTFPLWYATLAVPDVNYFLVFALSAFCVFCYCYSRYKVFLNRITLRRSPRPVPAGTIRKLRAAFGSKAGMAILVGIVQLFPMQMFLLIMRGSVMAQDEYIPGLNASLVVSIMLGLASLFIISSILVRPLGLLWLANIPLLLLLPIVIGLFSQATGAVPLLIAQLTKFGNVFAERITVAPKWCSSVKAVVDVSCNEKQVEPIALCNVHVMSRLGTESYILLRGRGRKASEEIVPLFLPTADVNVLSASFSSKSLSLPKIKEHLKTVSPHCTPEFDVSTIGVEFGFDEYVLSKDGKEQLTPLIEAILKAPFQVEEVEVIGHADNIGQSSRNDWLAGQRARRVALYLRKMTENSAPRLVINEINKGNAESLVSDCRKLKLQSKIKCEIPNRRVIVRIIPLKGTAPA